MNELPEPLVEFLTLEEAAHLYRVVCNRPSQEGLREVREQIARHMVKLVQGGAAPLPAFGLGDRVKTPKGIGVVYDIVQPRGPRYYVHMARGVAGPFTAEDLRPL